MRQIGQFWLLAWLTYAKRERYMFPVVKQYCGLSLKQD